MPRWVVAVAAVVLAAVLALVTISWATKSRPAYTGTPTPPPFSVVTPVVLTAGKSACQDQVALDTDTHAVVLVAWKVRGGGPPLRITVDGGGYHADAAVPRGYNGIGALTGIIPAPPRSVLTRVCVRNQGPGAVPLEATTEGRVAPRPVTTVDGKPLPQKMTLLLTEGHDRSLLSRRGQLLDRIAAFKPWWIGRGSLVLLGLLLLAGVPALAIAALWLSPEEGSEALTVLAAQPEDAQQERREEDL